MKPLKFQEIIKVLKDNGFTEDRVKGSHAQYKAVIDGQNRLVTVPIGHLADTAARGTFQSIVRQSGLQKQAFKA